MFLNAPCFRQPSPHRNPGGDCFACSLKNVIDFLYPEKPISFDQAYECFEDETGGCSIVECGRKGKGRKYLSNHWTGFYRALQNTHPLGYRLDWCLDVVHPNVDIERWSHSWGWEVDEHRWSRRVQGYLAQGYILVVEMQYEGKGPFTPDHKRNSYDHFAVIDGQRSFWKEHLNPDGTFWHGSGEEETHIVCSGKGTYWIDTEDLLYYHGVNGFYAIRRDTRVYRDYSWNESPENQAKIVD